MSKKNKSSVVVHWVTVRNEDTGKLLNSWSFVDHRQARIKRIEQEEALDPEGIQTNVSIETLPVGISPVEKTKG
jgi:hypothetical protein